MKKNSTHIQTQTNVSVGVAVALFLVAGGLAFAALPGVLKQENGSTQESQVDACAPATIEFGKECAEGAFNSASVVCGDGTKHVLEGEQECLEKEKIDTLAEQACSNSCGEKIAQSSTPNQEDTDPRPVLDSCQDDPLQPGEYRLAENIIIPSSENGDRVICFQTTPGESTTIDCQNYAIEGLNGNGMGFFIQGTGDIIENCLFEEVAEPIQISSEASNVVIRSNEIYLGGNEYGISIGSGSGHFLSGNTIENVLGSGVRFATGNNIQLRDNIIVNTGEHGIDGTVPGSVGRNVVLENVSIQNNIIRGSGANGINLVNVSKVAVSDNEIHSSAQTGISILNGLNLGISRNTVEQNGVKGLEVTYNYDQETRTEHVLSGNIFARNTEAGAEISTQGNQLRDNEFMQNSGFGLRITGDQNIIEGNLSFENQEGGIEIFQVNGTVLERNIVRDHNGRKGIVIKGQLGNGNQNTLRNNQLFRNETGLTLIHADQTLVSINRIYENEYGIKVLRDTSNTQLVGNIVERNEFGIHFGLTDEETAASHAFASQQAPIAPSNSTTIDDGQVCRNAQLDIGCYVQNEVRANNTQADVIGNCSIEPQWELNVADC